MSPAESGSQDVRHLQMIRPVFRLYVTRIKICLEAAVVIITIHIINKAR